ncbi:MAG TPA: SDR family oxidoreductase [Bacteroidia bacterium]|nr:SDR family oxidoreductase [Bacteroidia bacterium]
MNLYKDKVVWITGASSGIGEALAFAFASRGARLVLSARREDELHRVGKACGLAELDLMILPINLKDTSRASAYAAEVINKFGRIDILVNNAGVSQRSAAAETSEALMRELMEVNYFSAVNLSLAVLPYMKRQKEGQIVVISSIAGKFGFYLRSTYSAAKHALHGYFESLRLENEKDGIQIMLVCPGKIKTRVSLNALTSDGSKHNNMDKSHEHAMSPEACAQQIIAGLLNGREEIFIGGKELLIVKIRRWWPALFSKLIRKQSPY